MTINGGKRYVYGGRTPAQMVHYYDCKLMLLLCERAGHKAMIADLRRIMRTSSLTPAQARAVTDELQWRVQWLRVFTTCIWSYRVSRDKWQAKIESRQP
jgi:hypothetical protein